MYFKSYKRVGLLSITEYLIYSFHHWFVTQYDSGNYLKYLN